VDVFMGMHGAGFVNSFYLQPVSSVPAVMPSIYDNIAVLLLADATDLLLVMLAGSRLVGSGRLCLTLHCAIILSPWVLPQYIWHCCSPNESARRAQGAVMIQMFPWGWQLPDGWIDRECMFSHQAEAVGARYFHWLSTDRLKGLRPMCAPATIRCMLPSRKRCADNAQEKDGVSGVLDTVIEYEPTW